MKCVYIVVLNYKGWQDTLECLESLLKLTYPHYRIVIVDNASPNDSVERLKDWAEGRCAASCKSKNPMLRSLVEPVSTTAHDVYVFDGRILDCPITLIAHSENRGFAAGMNVGIRYALRHADCEYVWILNNDTVVRPDALDEAMNIFGQTETADVTRRDGKRIGIVSMQGYYYDAPDVPNKVSAECGWNHWLGRSARVEECAAARGDYRSYYGASFMITRTCLEYVGLMDERRFLYMEEEDWAEQLRRNDFYIAFAPKAVVYHKEGQSTKHNWKHLSRWGALMGIRSAVLWTRKFFPWCLPTVYGHLLLRCGYSVLTHRFWRAKGIAQVMLHPTRIVPPISNE